MDVSFCPFGKVVEQGDHVFAAIDPCQRQLCDVDVNRLHWLRSRSYHVVVWAFSHAPSHAVVAKVCPVRVYIIHAVRNFSQLL